MILTADRPERLDRFLARQLPEHSRTKLALWIREGGILVEGRGARPSQMLEVGSTVEVRDLPVAAPHDLSPADIPLDVRYEDDDLLVVNKPRGLATHPAASLKEPSLVNALLARSHSLSTAGGAFRPGIVHRLDKETTGLLVVAKNDSIHAELARQIEGRSADRRYVAVVAGRLAQAHFRIDAPIARDPKDRIRMSVHPRGKRAVTHVKQIDQLAAGTLIAVKLETGRTHQIRVHLAAVGHPVLGDRLYAPNSLHLHPLQLHAAYLAITHPVSRARIAVFAAPPDDFMAPVRRESVEAF